MSTFTELIKKARPCQTGKSKSKFCCGICNIHLPIKAMIVEDDLGRRLCNKCLRESFKKFKAINQ